MIESPQAGAEVTDEFEEVYFGEGRCMVDNLVKHNWLSCDEMPGSSMIGHCFAGHFFW